MLIKEAKEIIGGNLSKPSKMPGWGFSIPASRCITGAKLVQKQGTVCTGCYATKGRYTFRPVQNALEKRFQALQLALRDVDQGKIWVSAMSRLIESKKNKHFRWHDSGDIQSVRHLHLVCEVAKATPNVKHWIPTREYRMVKLFQQTGGEIPKNLCVRLSAHKIDGKAPDMGLPTSTVSSDGAERKGKKCPAPDQDNQCKKCRACWNPKVKNVDYHVH